MTLKIIGTGKGIPDRRVTNDELAGFLDTSDAWIVSRTGIHNRYVCTVETMTDLSSAAARQAVEQAGLVPGDIGMVIASTIGGDYRTPALASCVAERIGAKCPAFDINAACTGFIYALDVASGFLAAGKAEYILIVCAERMSAYTDWGDRNTSVLFGDGAAACVVASGNAIRYTHLAAAEAVTSIINVPLGVGNSPFAGNAAEGGFLHMNGQEVFKFAVNVVEAEMKLALQALGMAIGQIDWFLLHQANKRIIDSIRTKLGQQEEKFPTNIDRYGNLSSATIPLLLSEMLEGGRIKRGDTLFMSAFCAGLTAGSCVMVWE
jgi:3-oxoacyl-[acyl-carrier-protein] synthase-3